MADALHIDDPKANALAHELAQRTGETVTDAVVHALEERLERKPQSKRPETDAERAERRAQIMKILERMHRMPVLDPRGPDEIVGYDEDGLPS